MARKIRFEKINTSLTSYSLFAGCRLANAEACGKENSDRIGGGSKRRRKKNRLSQSEKEERREERRERKRLRRKERERLRKEMRKIKKRLMRERNRKRKKGSGRKRGGNRKKWGQPPAAINESSSVGGETRFGDLVLTQVQSGGPGDGGNSKRRLSWQLKTGAKKRPPFEALLNPAADVGPKTDSDGDRSQSDSSSSLPVPAAAASEADMGGSSESDNNNNESEESSLILLKGKLEAMMSSQRGSNPYPRETASRKPLPLFETVTSEAMADRRSPQGERSVLRNPTYDQRHTRRRNWKRTRRRRDGDSRKSHEQ